MHRPSLGTPTSPSARNPQYDFQSPSTKHAPSLWHWSDRAADDKSSGNSDGDHLTNFLEFAFGMNPTSPVLGRLAYAPNGTTTPGLPILQNTGAAQSPFYRAVFARRKDHVMAGISYQVQFSADLTRWTAAATAPVRLSGENADPVETVGVPFPATVPMQAGGSAIPQYFRIGTSQN